MKQILIEKIYAFEKKYLRYRAIGSALRFVIAVLLIWLSTALADHVFYFSRITRWGLWGVNVGLTLLLAYRLLVRPMLAYFRLKETDDLTPAIRRITRYFPQVGDDLISAYQLLRGRAQTGISTGLQQAAIQQILEKYKNYDFAERVRFKELVPEWGGLMVLLAGMAVLVIFQGNNIWHSTKRLLNPANPYLQMPAFAFRVSPGDTTLVKGDTFLLKVNYQGPPIKRCLALIKGLKETQTLTLNGQGTHFYGQLKNVPQNFEYQIAGEPVLIKDWAPYLHSEIFTVKVITLPVVQTVDITVSPPTYTGLPPGKLERNIGDVSALKGSEIEIRILANKPLAGAWLVFSWGDTIALKVRQTVAHGQFLLKHEGTYHLILQDTAGYRNRKPIKYRLTLLPDYPPLVEISDPGKNLELPLDAQLPVTVQARDDFGLRRLFLKYRIVKPQRTGDSTWQTVDVPDVTGNQRQMAGHYVLDFNTLPLAFGDQLQYYALAWDNNRWGGPGIGKSRVYFVRFPSLDEIFDATDQTQKEKAEDLKNVTDEARELNKTLKQLHRQLKQSRKLDWDKKNQLTEALERQKKLQKKVEEIRKALKDVTEKLEKNNLLSESLIKKYMQLQELLQNVMTPELQKALEKLQQKLKENVKPQDVEKALKEFTLNQEEFEKRIERTMELLKQVQLEQKMDELVKKAENLLRQQKKIGEQLARADSLSQEEKANLQEMQKNQKNLLERLSFDVQEVRKNPLLAKYPQTTQMLDSVNAQLQKQSLQKQMQQLSQQLANRQYQEARNTSLQAQSQMQQMQQTLQQAYQQMLSQSKQRIAQKMQRAIQRLLQLSKQQEQVYKKTRSTSPLSPKFNQVMREQGQVNANMNKLISEIVQLSRETFLIQPQMSQSLQSAARNMNNALQQLSERYKSGGMRYQKQAMAALNRGVGQMMQSQQQLGQSQSGTGFEQFMQQLQQMAGKQGQLNQQTLSLFKAGQNGRLSPQQQQELRRIAAEQAALRQALQELNQKMGQRENMLGRLGKVAQDMDKVVKDLLKQNLNRKTIERQQQILSRMLDAQKSIRQREYSKKRQAIRAKKYLAHDPGALKNPYEMDLKQLQDAMRKALEQGYNRDYQMLIEAYFKRLMRDYQKTHQQ